MSASAATALWEPAVSDVLLDAYERIGFRGNALTTEHFTSGRRSLQFVLSAWANRGISLWKVVRTELHLTQGIADYPLDPAIIDLLDVYRRVVQPEFFVLDQSTLDDGAVLAAGKPPAETDFVLDQSVLDGSDVLAAGSVPPPAEFMLDQSVLDGSDVLAPAAPAVPPDQPPVLPSDQPIAPIPPIDVILYPISRTEYAQIPNKTQQGQPSAFWFERTKPPVLHLWPVPDATLAWQLVLHHFDRFADPDPTMGNIGDLQNRFYMAYVCEVATDLALKWAPERMAALAAATKLYWMEASEEDREKAPMHIRPDFSAFFR